MFRRTSRQRLLPMQDIHPSAERRLSRSWADGFRREVWPLLLDAEASYAHLYSDRHGRPNWSVARILGLELIQELLNLTDVELEDALSFDLRLAYALELEQSEAYLSRRSLAAFRARRAEADPEGKLLGALFEGVLKVAVNRLSVTVSEQRLDSTAVMSNIQVRGQRALFGETLRYFGREVLALSGIESLLPESYGAWLADDEEKSWFGKGGCQTELRVLASWAVELHRLFAREEHKQVQELTSFQRLAQLVSDYCIVDVVSGQCTEVVRKGRRGGQSLQSPHDPDAAYGHKGVCYTVDVAETVGNEQTELITDINVRSGADPDWGKSTPTLKRLAAKQLLPKTCYADAGFPTPEALVEAWHMGVELHAPVGHHVKTGGLELLGRDACVFDSQGRLVKCPEGHSPLAQGLYCMPGCTEREMHALMDGDICRACPKRAQCVAKGRAKGRWWIRTEPRLIARDKQLEAQRNPEWWERYSCRSGIEATNSELKRGHGMRKLTVRGLAAVRRKVTLKATACNIKRWLRAMKCADNSPVHSRVGYLCSCAQRRAFLEMRLHLLSPHDRTWALQLRIASN